MILAQVTFHQINYSFPSVLMAVITSSLLLIVISFCLFSEKVMVNAGYKLISLFLIFTFLRFLSPIELPFSRNKNLPHTLSRGVSMFSHGYIHIFGLSLSPWDIFMIIWGIGSVVQLIRLIRSYLHFKRYIIIHSKDITDMEPYHGIIDKICMERRKRNVFHIRIIDDISAPMIYGIFTPYILIPSDLKLSSEDLYFALCHETAHHFHHDLLTKLGINILAIAYWWNPAIYILQNRANLLLEMRIDDYLTQNNKDITMSYMRCLINIRIYAEEKPAISPNISLSLVKNSSTDLEKRFLMLCNANKPKRHVINIFLTLLIATIYMLSYIYIFEAYSFPEETYINESEEQEFFLPLDSTYLIENADGTYDVYLDSPDMPAFYLETVDSLKYYDLGYPIYYLEKGNFK